MLAWPPTNQQIFPKVFVLGTEPRVNVGVGTWPSVPAGAWGAQS